MEGILEVEGAVVANVHDLAFIYLFRFFRRMHLVFFICFTFFVSEWFLCNCDFGEV